MLHTIYFDDIFKVYSLTNDILHTQILELLQKNSSINVGLCGGRSPLGIYELLRTDKRLPWDKVHLFLTDERIIPAESEESNSALIKKAFVNNIIENSLFPSQNFHQFPLDSPLEDAIENYNSQIQQNGHKYHLILLGAGEDGHIASLFPKHESILNDTNGFIIVNNAPKPPSQRVSISKNMLLDADIAIVLFIGESKSEAYKLFSAKPTNFYECPARLLHLIKDTYVITNIN